MATNYVTIQDICENLVANPPVHLQMVQVDTVWPFMGWGKFKVQYYTNTVCTFLAPDNHGI